MNNNFNYKKSLGQNFLKDNNIIDKIINSANIDKNTLVIEIGPGGGALSMKILPLCGYAILYEIDDRLEAYLKNKLNQYDNYSLVIGDFLKENIKDRLEKYHFSNLYVVANLPYYITTPIIMRVIEEGILPDKMVVMVQKEVAIRFAAQTGSKDYGSLTVFLNYYYDIQKLFDVSRNCFEPKPNVDSAVVCMSLKKDRLEVLDIELFNRIVRDSFSMKRKTIRNNLKKYDLEIVHQVLNKYGYDLSVRAEQLSLEVFVDMANELAKLNV